LQSTEDLKTVHQRLEVLEHLDPFRIPAFEQVLFAHAAPGTVILTTPNREYNVKYPALKTGALRHGDHRFEWTRQEFADWAAHVCRSYGYQVVCSGIGEEDPQVGAPTAERFRLSSIFSFRRIALAVIIASSSSTRSPAELAFIFLASSGCRLNIL